MQSHRSPSEALWSEPDAPSALSASNEKTDERRQSSKRVAERSKDRGVPSILSLIHISEPTRRS
eukprot:5653184-Prymnesium_polylepis.1